MDGHALQVERGEVRAAVELARGLLAAGWTGVAADGRERSRWVAVGDPQGPLSWTLGLLGAHGLLTADGRLRPDVGLVSIGDHFDYGTKGVTYDAEGARVAGAEGLAFLRWLAEHPPDQVLLLAGNHDLARVMELAHESDESYAAARALARRVAELEREGERAGAADARATFTARFQRIPTPDIALRDYCTFTEAQRTLVQQLLLSGRMRLAQTGTLASGEPVLLTHAGVTGRELGLLGVGFRAGPEEIAHALNAHLEAALARVRAAWEAGQLAALDLRPLHIEGTAGREGGGLLYHRPAHPTRRSGSPDLAWEFDPASPRRFDPRTLPPGLVQVCGHSGHGRCLRELDEEGWVPEEARNAPCRGLRTLSAAEGVRVRYRPGVEPPVSGEATMYLIDPELSHRGPGEGDLFALGSVRAACFTRESPPL